MASAPSKTTTVKTVNNKTGVTTSTSTRTSGGSTTVTKTTTIGTPKTTTTPSSASTPATLPGAVLGSKWIAGPNDGGWGLCAPVAVANALLGALGVTASNAAIERLYRAAGGIGATGVTVPSALAAARSEGLAGCRLRAFRRAALDDADILLLALPDQPGKVHAAAFAGMTAITWGGEIPLEDMDATIIGAWSLTWHGTEEITRG
jgi:hypothetical protein